MRFKLKGDGCDLAVRIGGKAYFVDGTDIDSHGDAHGKNGLCNAVRKAEVQGELINDRFKVTYFILLKSEEKKRLKLIKRIDEYFTVIILQILICTDSRNIPTSTILLTEKNCFSLT